MPEAPVAAAAAPLLAGAAALALLSFATGQAADVQLSQISGRSLFGLAYLVLAGTVITFAAYIWLLGHVAPTRVATYAFVNPVVAVLLGWAIGGEQLTAATLLAAAVIVAAVAVAVTDRSGAARRPAPVPAPSPSPPNRAGASAASTAARASRERQNARNAAASGSSDPPSRSARTRSAEADRPASAPAERACVSSGPAGVRRQQRDAEATATACLTAPFDPSVIVGGDEPVLLQVGLDGGACAGAAFAQQPGLAAEASRHGRRPPPPPAGSRGTGRR